MDRQCLWQCALGGLPPSPGFLPRALFPVPISALSRMDNDERGKLLKFDTAAKRKKLYGGAPGKGPNRELMLKILGTVVAAAAVALGYYALYGIG